MYLTKLNIFKTFLKYFFWHSSSFCQCSDLHLMQNQSCNRLTTPSISPGNLNSHWKAWKSSLIFVTGHWMGAARTQINYGAGQEARWSLVVSGWPKWMCARHAHGPPFPPDLSHLTACSLSVNKIKGLENAQATLLWRGWCWAVL